MKLTRRAFCSILGLLGIGDAVAKSQPILEQQSTGYFYDWAGPGDPKTNDPRYGANRRLTRGPHNLVFLDGVDVSDRLIQSLVTGPSGFIKEVALTSDGQYIIDYQRNSLVRKITRGLVEYRDMRY